MIFWFLVTPIRRKSRLFGLVALDYSCILVFYFLLAFTAIFAFDELNDLYTLNFQPTPGEPWYKLVVHYFLSLFPVFTLSTSFPIIAITLISDFRVRIKLMQNNSNLERIAITNKVCVHFLQENQKTIR